MCAKVKTVRQWVDGAGEGCMNAGASVQLPRHTGTLYAVLARGKGLNQCDEHDVLPAQRLQRPQLERRPGILPLIYGPAAFEDPTGCS